MSSGAVTPMMRQYHDAKREHPDALLFFRMGDFYEMFHEDAKVAARELGLTLTSRDKANPIPMAGVPVRAVDTYLRRLLEKGHKVAICEQMQDPREVKGIVERAVVRVVTPGTVTEDTVLEAKTNNFLAGVFADASGAGLAWVDLSTGTFRAEDCGAARLLDEVARVDPAEILVPQTLAEERPELIKALSESARGSVSRRPDWAFDRAEAHRTLTGHFGTKTLDGFGCGDLTLALNAAGALLQYLSETQKTGLDHIARIERVTDGSYLVLDRVTRRALEITEAMGEGTKKNTLLGVLDHSKTAMGGRRLRRWLVAPLVDPEAIRARLDAVDELKGHDFLRRDVRDALAGIYDLERIAAKIATGRANARDLVSLRQSADALPGLTSLLEGAYSGSLAESASGIDPLTDLRDRIAASIHDEPPATIKDGGLIREGFDEKLDELRNLRRDGKQWIADFQAREAERTGISTLKVGYNRVFGYYIEITHANRDKAPAEYHRKQTLKNAERYITPELKEYETKVLTADERAKDLELERFMEVRAKIGEHVGRIQAAAESVARIDALASLAEAADRGGYARPEVDGEPGLEIVAGRHPVLEQTSTEERFVPNDVRMEAESRRVLVITGPNMSGKSTYLRQTALIVLMAQCGSFVPAASAKIGVADRIFSRVGASDDLSQGKSTFMVEMSETANILNNATTRSLLVLDEIGRGTSTYDGVAIAWAVTEHIARVVGARTLFATHYHELTELADRAPGVTNLNVAVSEWGEEIVFLRKIEEGGTDR
ncbi:MAG: DNA mismatch repair protein MutS, partial [Planctomycetota bacterium]